MIDLVRKEMNVICGLCKGNADDTDGAGSYISTNCCHRLFHKKCIKDYQEHNSLCPGCESPYQCLNLDDLGMNMIINGKIQYDKLIDFYAVIMKYNGDTKLYKLDKTIQEQCIDYKGFYKGYYPLEKLDNSLASNVQDGFRAETYGIFERFCWDNFIICGSFLAKLATGVDCTGHPFYIVLYSCNYKLIRQRLKYFCKFLYERFLLDPNSKIPVTIKKNRITFYIPGFERGIVLFINMLDELSTIMSNMEYYTNGIYYDGKDCFVTIPGLKGIRGSSFCQKPRVDHICGYEQTLDTFQDLNKQLSLVDTQILCDAVFGKYILHLHLNDSKRVPKCIYKEWYENTDLNDNIDVDFQPNAGKYRVFITAPDGSEHDFNSVVVSVHIFQKFINNVVYANRTVE